MKFGAIDAGGKKFICRITDEQGNTLEKTSFLTETPEKTIPLVIDFFRNKDISALGVGCFGPLDLNPNSDTYGYITSSPKTDWKNYNILGHLDLIKRYGPYDEILDDDYFIDIITEILKQVIYDGKGIEVNTSCFKYNLPDLTPSRKIIELYKSLGGEIITTGSDAHATGFLACNFKYIYDYLKSIGFEYVCTFDKMKPLFNKI